MSTVKKQCKQQIFKFTPITNQLTKQYVTDYTLCLKKTLWTRVDTASFGSWQLDTGHTPSEKGAVSVNVLTIDELLQHRNGLFSFCNSNSSQKAALCSLLGTLSVLWTAIA